MSRGRTAPRIQRDQEELTIPIEHRKTFAEIDRLRAEVKEKVRALMKESGDPSSRSEKVRALMKEYKPRIQAVLDRSPDPKQARVLFDEQRKRKIQAVLEKMTSDKGRMPQVQTNGGKPNIMGRQGGAHMLPDTAPDRLAKAVRPVGIGGAHDANGHAGARTPAGGVYITPAWQKARESYQPGDKISHGVPVNETTKAMVKRGEIDP